MNIDWAEAPEGATHYSLYENVGSPWLMETEEGRFFWDDYIKDWEHYGSDNAWPKHFSNSIPRPIEPAEPVWNGEGLPPVGSTVEALVREHGDEQEWEEVKVIAHDEGVPIVKWDYKYFSRDLSTLRPIRTPEQIAAEERDKAIAEISASCPRGVLTNSELIAWLYDAGYCKVDS